MSIFNPLCGLQTEKVTEFKKCQCACKDTGSTRAEVKDEMPLSLDAREVLMHLNEMGYRKITAEQLKEFMQDLRKLIKYEECLGVLQQPTENPVDKRFETLHKASTASYRAKTKASKSAENRCSKMKDSGKVTPKKTAQTKHTKKVEEAAPSLKEKNREKAKYPISAAEKKTKMWIRPKSASSTSTVGRMDPVQRYQFYSEQWKRFKNNLPGESDRTKLRWDIRQRLLGA